MDIVTFVRDRLSEQEIDAQSLRQELSRWERERDMNGPDGSQGSILAVTLGEGLLHPARVLAQVARLRAIVTMYERAYDGHHIDENVWEQSSRESLEDVVCHLAGIWSDHADYDPAWTPD